MKNLLINPGIIKRIKTFLTGKYVEDGNTASQNIPAGKWVIWKNQMCQAKTAITMGDTLSSANLDVQGDDGIVNALNSKITQMDWDALSASNTVTLPNTYDAYTVPADGYILSQSYIAVGLSDGNYYEFGSGGVAIFVKKGTKVHKAGNTPTYEVKFFPVISNS